MPLTLRIRIRRRMPRPASSAVARSVVAAFALLLALASLLGVAGAQLLQEQGTDIPTAATGHAQVIAQGVAPMTDDQAAWRVTRSTAPRPMDLPENQALGFVLADDDALQLVDRETEAQARLAAGEAAFVPEGARQLQFALGDGPVAYYRIDLVPAAEAEDDLGDEPVFAGEAFAAPDGLRDLDLVRDVLDAGEASAIEHDRLPILLLATDGEIQVEVAGRDSDDLPVVLAAGEAGTFQGPLRITASDDDSATFVAAVIGPEVPPVPTQPGGPAAEPATPDAETASIELTKYTCPAGYEGKDKYQDCVEPGAGIEFTVAIYASEWATSAETDDEGKVGFTGLGGGGEYLIIEEVPSDLSRFEVNCFAEPAPGAPEPRQVEITRIEANLIGLILEPGAQVACTWFNIPADAQGTAGTIALTVQLCPTADTPLEQCEYFVDPSAVATLTGPVFLSTDGSSEVPVRIHGVSWVWGEEGGIPFGTYYLATKGINVPAEYALDRVEGSLGASDIGWAVEVSEANPNAIVNVVYVSQVGGVDDADGDGATTEQEAQYGTDPNDPDTDDDGASDGQEINYGEPGPSPVVADSDGDGLLDGAEMNETGTNPAGADSDGDGVSDGDEVNAGTDPLDPSDPPGDEGA